MVNPQTVNVGIIVPLTGADVDTWGEDDVNPNMASIDGFIAGVQIISAGSSPITLTSPAGFTPTPGAGPTQAENRVLRFTGTLTANVAVTLPLPGAYVIENLTTGNFVLSFRGVTATEVIGTPQGECVNIYNDGSNVRFVGLARMAAMEMWAGLSAIPAWVTACTVDTYQLCDGTVYNIADYPALGARLGSTFGGNGLTTFAVPDMRGRVPLAYDGTGTRITTAGCGINGQTLGGYGGSQNGTILQANLPNVNFVVAAGQSVSVTGTLSRSAGNVGAGATGLGINANSIEGLTMTSAGTVTSTGTAASGGSGTAFMTVQPSIVTGIWVCKT